MLMTDGQSLERDAVAGTRATRAAARRTSRREALVDASFEAFIEDGVAATSVDDIVARAHVAKGTFYLYFRTKQDAVDAVAERIVDGVAANVAAAASAPGLAPVERLVSLGRSIGQVGSDPHELEIIEVFHRPENRAIHDRLSGRIIRRLAPTVGSLIADGIEQGTFARQDPDLAAAFVLATFSSLHDIVGDGAGVDRAAAALNVFILRGLGYQGAT
jgi:AcrR family transcriptional regulator